jgi:pyridoxal phosphate enzyme (YggS family)
MSIKDNIFILQQNLPDECKLVVVTKTQPIDKIMEAYEAGHRIFGENRVQELIQKYEALPKDIEWHLIGHLQTNKVKYIAPFVNLIHSVDSLKLLLEINKQAAKLDRVIDCLLQVHIAKEESKFGLSFDELDELIQTHEWSTTTNICVKGLMGMATFTEDEKKIRDEFKSLKLTFDTLRSKTLPDNVQMTELSMGMSSDYLMAVEEESTLVRIGSAVFGERIKA